MEVHVISSDVSFLKVTVATFGRFARSSLFTGCRLVDIKKRICLPRMTPTDRNHPFPKFLQLLAPGCLAGLVVKEKIVILVIIVIIVTKG